MRQEVKQKLEILTWAVSKAADINIARDTRAAGFVRARLIYYKIGLDIAPQITLTDVAKYVGRTHATVLFHIAHFDRDIASDERWNQVYLESKRLFEQRLEGYYGENESVEDQLVKRTIALADEVETLRVELKEAHAEVKLKEEAVENAVKEFFSVGVNRDFFLLWSDLSDSNRENMLMKAKVTLKLQKK